MLKRVAFVSVHTSPLATLGGKDTGAMNVFVRETARELARRGIGVDVFTRSARPGQIRRDTPTAPNDRVTACTAVIDAKVETGRKLAVAYCNRGHGLTEKRDLDSAMSDLDEAIRLDPTYACAYSNRGRVHALKRDFVSAMADYDEAIRIDSGFALAYNNRGDAWFHKGDLDRALADFSAIGGQATVR